jgi:hypothetical protein
MSDNEMVEEKGMNEIHAGKGKKKERINYNRPN